MFSPDNLTLLQTDFDFANKGQYSPNGEHKFKYDKSNFTDSKQSDE